MKNYQNFIDENLNETLTFNKFINKIVGLFKTNNKPQIRKKLEKLLNEYRIEILMQKKNVKKKELNKKIEELKSELGDELISDMLLDNFIRGIYTVTIPEINREEKINKYFDKYIKSLSKKLDIALGTKKEKESILDLEDEVSGELSDVIKLKKQVTPKVPKKLYEQEKTLLQIELNKMVEYIISNNEKLVILCEGRDSAGKGATIKIFTQYMNSKFFNIAEFGIPSAEEKENWFKRYIEKLPKPGHITFYDRSWYNRAVNDPAMGYCTEEEYMKFMRDVVPFENSLIDNGFTIIKFWFSIDPNTQQLRFAIRKASPLKYWKFSPNDEKVADKWELFSKYKEQMFRETSTEKSPWIVIDANDKRLSYLNAMKYVLSQFDYPDKNYDLLEIQPEILQKMI